jgi:hypothetical protein
MGSRKCSLKVVTPSGTRLSGTAAILHMTSSQGGFDEWLHNYSVKLVKNTITDFMNEQRKPKLRRID